MANENQGGKATNTDAEIADLRRQAAEAVARAEAAEKRAATLEFRETERLKGGLIPAGRYLVQVPEAPDWVVECDGTEHPFEVYKKAVGMKQAAYEYTVTPATAEMWTGDQRKQPEGWPEKLEAIKKEAALVAARQVLAEAGEEAAAAAGATAAGASAAKKPATPAAAAASGKPLATQTI